MSQASGRDAAARRSNQDTYSEYIKVQTSGFKAIDLVWIIRGQKSAGGNRFAVLYKGNVPPNLVNDPMELKSPPVSSVPTAPQFDFTYRNVRGDLPGSLLADGVAWNGQGVKPTIPLVTLPTPARR
jgi:hypothetical protein